MQKTNIPQAESKSADLLAQNIEQLKQIFPEVIKEGKVDFEALHDLLGNYADTPEERFALNWAGKANARREAQKRSTGTLRPCPEDSVDWDSTENLYIEGDNLEVLKLMQKSYHSRVKMIYIDPPYNTGKNFVYKDNYTDNIANYLEQTGQDKKLSTNTESDGRYHSNWLNMMYPRLKLARNLLTDDGVIFISIDDNEVANLRKVCDEIFGEENFVGNIIWQTATDNNPRQIATEHEYVICYAKNLILQPKWLIPSSKAERIIQKYNELKSIHKEKISIIQKELTDWISKNADTLKGATHYNYVDEKGVYYPGNSSNTKPGGYTFNIVHPITNRICKKPDYGYRWTEKTFWDANEKGDVEWGKDETVIPKIKKRINTVNEMLKSSYYEDNRYWTKYLNTMFGRRVFENPKSVNLLIHITKFTVHKDSIILDFFSGSATTAHAVMQLNAEDGGNRKYICVQLPEQTPEDSEARKAGYATIPEIAKERIRRAGKKILEEQKSKAEKRGWVVCRRRNKEIRHRFQSLQVRQFQYQCMG